MSFPLTRETPALVLAPMEGVTDEVMREVLTKNGAYTHCVTEFFRISNNVPKTGTIAHHVPELMRGAVTAFGVPVQMQFLGGDPEFLAQAASNAVTAGARSIDLNFGCPAPTVNRHDGGAALLKSPDRIEIIVRTVRQSVPKEFPVSAKLRLGWENTADIHVNAERAARGGASWITIHGRTRMQGYQPPAYWGPIGDVRRNLDIPVVANGEIWNIDDFKRCRDASGCRHFMIGRASLGDPGLSHRIAQELGIIKAASGHPGGRPFTTPLDFEPLFLDYVAAAQQRGLGPIYQLKRLKQWVAMSQVGYKHHWAQELKRSHDLDQFFALIRQFSPLCDAKIQNKHLAPLNCVAAQPTI